MTDAPKRRSNKAAQTRSRRRPLREKVQLRAALVLEEAGELLEAARLYEHAGEHDHAASLRLEHVRTVLDKDDQLTVLRQACALAAGDGPSVLALHARLAQALGERARSSTDTVRHRQLLAEQAQHLELADLGAEAGTIYEALGDLPLAARAYQQAGAITELELVFANIDVAQRQADARRGLAVRIEHARRTGRRREAWTILTRTDESPAGTTKDGHVELASERERFNLALLPKGHCTLRWRARPARSGTVRVSAGSRLLIGRLPTADIPLSAPDLSREHAWLEYDDTESCIVARDSGSRAGTFWHGTPLAPDEPMPLRERGELGLGLATTIHVLAKADSSAPATALLRVEDTTPRYLFLPRGGSLRLDENTTLPAELHYEDPFFVLALAQEASAKLNGQTLRAGSRVELLQGDVLHITPADPDREIVLEVDA